VARDERKDVVEVVGDVAGKGVHGFHLLRLAELPSEVHLMGHVALQGHIVDDLARGVSHARDRRVFFEERTVFSLVDQVAVPRLAPRDRLP
jgi:hypothetical protein